VVQFSDADAHVLVAYDVAVKADKTAKDNPQAAADAWHKLATTPGRNPYREDAEKRARQWREYAEERRKLAEQRKNDHDQLKMVLPLEVMADSQKQELLLRYVRLYGGDDSAEMLAQMPAGEPRKHATDAIECELRKSPAACLRVANVREAARDVPGATYFFEKACEG